MAIIGRALPVHQTSARRVSRSVNRSSGHSDGSRPSILFLSSDSIYPNAIGGMEIRGRDVCEALSTIASVRVMSAPSGKAPFASATNPWLGRPRLPATAAELMTTRLQVRRFLGEAVPSVIYLNKIDGFAPTVLHELLSIGSFVVAWFGDPHQGRFVGPVLDGRWFDSLPSKTRRLGGIAPLPEDARRRIFYVFNCHFLSEHYAQSLIPDQRQAVIYEGVDTTAFAPRPDQQERPHFVFLGRATREKGFLDFCQVMAALPDACVASIDIVADGPALAEGLSVLRKSGRDRVLLAAGSCRREDVPARLRSRSILLLPSYEEGLPGAVIEAMAAGLCVVASAVGGVPELVREGDTGLTHAPGDLDGLLAQTRRVAESPELRQKLARRGRAFVERQHGRERWLKQTLEVVTGHGAIRRTSNRRTWKASS